KEAERLRQQVSTFQQGHVVVLTVSPVYKCPAAPYEAAMLLRHYFQTHGARRQIRISFYAAEGGPLAVAGDNVSESVRGMLQERDIAYHPQHVIQTIDTAAHTLHFANGVEDSYDLLVYVPAHKPPRVIQEAGLLGQNGWIEVDRHTLETKVPGVYAIGDVTGIPLEMGKPLPKAGVFAHAQAKVVANNIACKITGKGRLMEFNGHGECFVEIGDRKAGFAHGDFYASPSPAVKVARPGVRWHLGKVAFEKNWFRTWF
ncbi:MAG: FAD-dependent oxidoreductase, partial [Bacilli bacterium]